MVYITVSPTQKLEIGINSEVAIYIQKNEMKNLIDADTPVITDKSIQQVAAPKTEEAVVEQITDVIPEESATVNPTEEVIEKSTLPDTTQPIKTGEEVEMIKVGELLDEKEKQEHQQKLHEDDDAVINKIKESLDIKATDDVIKKETTDTPPVETHKSDELSDGIEGKLKQIKSHADTQVESYKKIADDANEKAFIADKTLEAKEKERANEKTIYENRINKLNEQIHDTKGSTISADDEAIVMHDYLRKQFKKDKDNPIRGEKLGNYHLAFAASSLNIPQEELFGLVRQYHVNKKGAQDAMSNGYQTGGGGGVTTKTYDTNISGDEMPIKELL